MPTYVYECPTHGEFERVRKMSETDLGESSCVIEHCTKVGTRVYDAKALGLVTETGVGHLYRDED